MSVTTHTMESFRSRYDADPVRRALEGPIGVVGLAKASRRADVVRRHTFEFSVTVPAGEITNQKKSGRCWIFASCTSLRAALMERYETKDFRLAPSYVFFYDKIEKANTFLDHIEDTLDAADDDRVVRAALDSVVSDGGDWDYFVSLVKKWGIVPYQAMPDTENSTDSHRMVEQMNSHLRHAAALMRRAHREGRVAQIPAIREEALYAVYGIARACLGTPPSEFTYGYRDKDDTYHRIGPMTPRAFVTDVLGEDVLDSRVVIGYDPRPAHPVHRLLRVPHNKSVAEGRALSALTVTLEEMKAAVIAQLRSGQAVYFGCDVDRDTDRELGIMDPQLFDWQTMLPALASISDAERVAVGEVVPTHAMAFTGVDLDEQERPVNWRVENSWGEDSGRKGVYSMSDGWFDRHMVTCVVDKRHLSEEILAGLAAEPIDLEPWDALFGAV
ncbi:MAG: C1 family peptidase [Actinomycetaceae bacterium]|nr:C1 family peptidase [Actinomycetaceae bacterium]